MRPAPAWTWSELAVAKLSADLEQYNAQHSQRTYELHFYFEDEQCRHLCSALANRSIIPWTLCNGTSKGTGAVDHPARVLVLGNQSRVRGDPLTRLDVLRHIGQALQKARRPCISHAWVLEPDVAYTGDWARLLAFYDDGKPTADLLAHLPNGQLQIRAGEELRRELTGNPALRWSAGNLVEHGFARVARIGLYIARFGRRLFSAGLAALERGVVSKGEALWPSVCLNELPDCRIAGLEERHLGSPFWSGVPCASIDKARTQLGKHPEWLPPLFAGVSFDSTAREKNDYAQDVRGLQILHRNYSTAERLHMPAVRGKLLHPWKWDFVMKAARWRRVLSRNTDNPGLCEHHFPEKPWERAALRSLPPRHVHPLMPGARPTIARLRLR